MEFELERRKKETKEHDASIFYGMAVEGMKKGDAQAQNYWGLIRTNRRFRLYLLSYVTSHVGEWLTYIASLSTIEAIQAAKGMETTSGRVVSRLIIIRLVPNILFSPFGGILADGLDRRKVMICLDLVGAATVFLFVAAVQVRSIGLIYVATFIQECVSGLYEPSRSAILPMLVSGEEDMKRATTISGLAWSSVAAFGAALSGLVVGLFGVKTCFAIDCVTYVISAWLMWMVDGNWGTVTTEEDAHESLLDYIRGMLTEGTHYIWTSHFGGLVLIKATASLVYGGFDVLNTISSWYSFACSGIGCLLGPMLVDPYTDVARPKTLQFTCVASFIFLTIGSIVLGFSTSFWIACTFTLIRAAGSSVLWINSSILIQKFSLLSESFSAYLTGRLLDESNLSAEDVSLLLGSLSAILSVGWFIYHVQGRGAVWSPEEDSSGSHSLNTYKNSLAETTALVELIS